MKKRSISDISHKGGFPRAIDDVVRTNEPLIITIRGESVVMISPCPPGMEKVIVDNLGFGKVMAMLSYSDMDEHVLNYAVSQFTNGLYAQAILLEMLGSEQFDELFDRGKELVKSINDFGTKAGRQMLADFEKFQKSSAQDKALSSHDNLSGVVPKVKQEGLPIDGSPSVSRKRGKPSKTEVSPLPKAKIGTKREKSA
jgi:hypothetical protein